MFGWKGFNVVVRISSGGGDGNVDENDEDSAFAAASAVDNFISREAKRPDTTKNPDRAAFKIYAADEDTIEKVWLNFHPKSYSTPFYIVYVLIHVLYVGGVSLFGAFSGKERTGRNS